MGNVTVTVKVVHSVIRIVFENDRCLGKRFEKFPDVKTGPCVWDKDIEFGTCELTGPADQVAVCVREIEHMDGYSQHSSAGSRSKYTPAQLALLAPRQKGTPREHYTY